MDIALDLDEDAIVMQITDDGEGIPASTETHCQRLATAWHPCAIGSAPSASRLDLRNPASGGTHYCWCEFPPRNGAAAGRRIDANPNLAITSTQQP